MNNILKFKFLFFITLFAVVNTVVAQELDVKRLAQIAEEQSVIAANRKIEVSAYLKKFGEDRRVLNLGEGRKVILKNVVNGVPQYISTFNLQARNTTGVERIQSSTGLNLNLKGNNITVGVWDGGLILDNHIELMGRVVNKNVADISNHATHVAGTIIAAGLNESAMGMAPEANVLGYYAFGDDLGPMALEAANGLVLSNHSYGLVLGWRFDAGNQSWIWFGGSGDTDERFGHYSNNSRAIDDIAYNAPYYTIVWSAGNDRNDVGDGTKPADGPHNTLGPSAVSKNVITVGAITGFNEYIDETSIVMSSFSSWGPTNDGRIKPDIVADGVDLFSTASANTSAYTTISGTSMSAPSVTGSLAVLQQYYREQNDTFLTAAMLKSIVIHSAREAGNSAGPDMVYGWGVLNTFDALEILQNINGVDTLLIDSVLNDQQTIEYELFSDGVLPITATLVWTDVPGTPGALGDNNLLLINDLDIKLIDDEGMEVRPWVMEPANPLIAQRGDNFRDNIERINFYQPEPRRYRLRISHKGTLVNSKQAFALTITGGAINPSPFNENYWIASSGNFGLSANWSQESGGIPSGVVSLASSAVIFDNNSAFANGDVIELNGNLSVENFIWLSSKQVTLDLMGYTLTITGQLKISEANLTIRNGALNYLSDKSEDVSLNFDGTDNCTLLININANLSISSNIKMYKILHQNGELNITNRNIQLSKFIIEETAKLSLEENTLLISDSLWVKTNDLQASSNVWSFGGTSFNSLFPIVLNDELQIDGSSVIVGKISVQKLIINGSSLSVYNHLLVDSLLINEGSNVEIFEGDTIEINNYIDILSSVSNNTIIRGSTPTQKAQVIIGFRKLLCFDDLDMSNLEVLSESIFNVGLGSSLINTLNFEQKDCDDILFADFYLSSNCSNSVLSAIDLSQGNIDDYNWSFVGGNTLQNDDSSSPEFYYLDEGSYSILLEVSNGTLSHSYEIDVEIETNPLENVEIAKNSTGLVSTREGESYQWYLNSSKLVGEVDRTLVPVSSGRYRVVYYVNESGCLNRISNGFEELVTDLAKIPDSASLVVFPNPFESKFNVSGLEEKDVILIYNMMGNLMVSTTVMTSNSIEVDLSGYAPGIYLVKINRNKRVLQRTILKLK